MPIVTKFPVYDLEKRLLVEAGTELTPEFLAGFQASQRKSHDPILLIRHGLIRDDLLRQLRTPPYDIIFSQPDKVSDILAVMERVRLPPPIFKGLDYFRRHDFHTYRHMLMIFALSILIAGELEKSEDLIHDKIAHSGPTHDLGKIAVPLAILLKKEPLTVREHDMLRHHTLTGYLLLAHYMQDTSNIAAVIARDHHERRNGSGYPGGIEQRDISVEITTVADIYDALIAQRPYRPASFDNRTALEELTLMAERGELGWDVVRVLISYNRRNKPSYNEFEVSLERRGHAPDGNVYGKVINDHQEDE